MPEMFDKILRCESIPGIIYVIDNKNEIIARSDMTNIETVNDSGFLSFNGAGDFPGQIVLDTSVPAMDGWKAVCVLDRSFMREAFRVNWMQMLVLILTSKQTAPF